MVRLLPIGVLTLLTGSLLAPWNARAADTPEPGKAAVVEDSSFYPLKVGTTWEYKLTTKGNSQTVIVKVAKHDKIGNTMCALLETSVNGNVSATEHVAATKDGVYRYTFSGQDIQPPVCFLKLPPKKGEKWKVDSKIGTQTGKATFVSGEEEVSVPAGKFKTITSATDDFEAAGMKVPVTYWFASNTGIVKQVVKFGDQEVLIELVKFMPAGK